MAEKVERRLATILSADVLGYSRLMEADEKGTRLGVPGCTHIVEQMGVLAIGAFQTIFSLREKELMAAGDRKSSMLSILGRMLVYVVDININAKFKNRKTNKK